MPNSAIVYLPLNTYVNVKVYTNAMFNQQVTITQENAQQAILTGSGEHDTPMANGQFSIQTPSSSINPLGYKVTVTAASWQNNQWVASQLSQGACAIMYYQLALVVSEDFIDQDWNDGVVVFTWWTPPSLRERFPDRHEEQEMVIARP